MRIKRTCSPRRVALLALTVAIGTVLTVPATSLAKPAAAAGGSPITVFAAASLTEVFPRIDRRPRYSFASSNSLLQQLRQGAPADVFASASPRETTAAYSEGLCELPRTFAYNKLVVLLPKSNPAGIRSVYGLTRSNVKVVIAQAGVPVGDYTRRMLRNIGIFTKVMANVVSQEPDVKAVVSKVVLGEADAGFVYRTDVKPVADRAKFVLLPSWAQPPIRYQICVVESSDQKAAARAFVKRVLGPIGRGNLSGALFGLPPKQ